MPDLPNLARRVIEEHNEFYMAVQIVVLFHALLAGPVFHDDQMRAVFNLVQVLLLVVIILGAYDRFWRKRL